VPTIAALGTFYRKEELSALNVTVSRTAMIEKLAIRVRYQLNVAMDLLWHFRMGIGDSLMSQHP
jgi:hypothetical protein